MISISAPVLLTYLLLGAIAGVIGGLLGLGGGIVIVPALLFLFIYQGVTADILMQTAVATSLATIVITSVSATWAHHRHRAVLWPVVMAMGPGIILGAVLGALSAHLLQSNTLRVIFGIFEILVAIQIGSGLKPAGQRVLPGRAGMGMSGLAIGTVSSLLGIGGGTLTVPFLLWCNVHLRNAVATSSACGLPIAAAGAVAMMITGFNHPGLPAGSTGYVYWVAALPIMIASIVFAPLGAWLTHTVPVAVLRKIFAVILALVGIKMLL